MVHALENMATASTSAAATEAALDIMQSMYRQTITRDEAIAVYKETVKVWKMQMNTSWNAARRDIHACSAKRCTMDALHVNYLIARGKDYFSVVNVCVTRPNDPTAYYGGSVPYQDGAHYKCPASESLVRGAAHDAYVCTTTGLLHICNDRLCGGSETADPDAPSLNNGSGAVCGITGIAYGGAPMVHQFWKPASVAGSAESTGLTRQDVLSGRAAFARQRKSCIASYGATWSDFKEWLNTAPLHLIDTAEAMHRTLKQYAPKTVTLHDSYNEYVSWGFMRVASLFSAKRFACDVEEGRHIRDIANRNVQRIVRTAPRPMTILDVRTVQIEHMRRHDFPLSFALPEPYLRQIITNYAQKCFAYWCTICTATVGPGVTPADRARQLVYKDFVVACMYIFANGLLLPYDVSGTPGGERIVYPDELLKWTLPKQTLLHHYTCDKDAVVAQRNAIESIIINAVRDRHINPLLLVPNPEKLSDITIDILPPLCLQPDRKRKR